jgi:aminoglycoside phosphotransferase (APT) family kinase protein
MGARPFEANIAHEKAPYQRGVLETALASVNLEVLQNQLQRFASAHYGESATAGRLRVMPGHAGLSFGFTVAHERGGDPCEDSVVLRLPPKGVRQSGNTDVLRQAPLLEALQRSGVPVPSVRWYGDDLRWFEVPYLMVEWMQGRTFFVWDPDPSFDRSPGAVGELYGQAVRALAQVHQLDWRKELADWESPRSIEEEIVHWDPILARAAEPDWVSQGEEVRALLLERQPAAPPIGLFHGDYQGSNLLFQRTEGEELVALLDWEISGIGAQLLDLGWLLVFIDPMSWSADHGPIASVPQAEPLIALYETKVGRKVEDIAWYRAMAGYRFGVITGFNVMLHRRGKRHDPAWELLALSVPALFGRAKEMLLSL